MTPSTTAPADSTIEQTRIYERRLVPWGFDVLISGVFLPFGGVRRLRSQAIDLLGLEPGMHVLELGCGTGGITRLLVERGVSVTGVDGSTRMLARAKRRAPQATFLKSRLEALEIEGPFDCALFAFVLHELSASERKQAIAVALGALAPGGLLAILDHAVPQTRGLATAWRSFLLRLEPPTVVDCIKAGYEAELAAQGLTVTGKHALAAGTAQLLLASRTASAAKV